MPARRKRGYSDQIGQWKKPSVLRLTRSRAVRRAHQQLNTRKELRLATKGTSTRTKRYR